MKKPRIQTDAPGFIKDPNSGAVINTNLGEYQAILARRKTKNEQDSLMQEIKKLRSDLDTVMTELQTLKERFTE